MGLFTNKFVAEFQEAVLRIVLEAKGITMVYSNETAAQTHDRIRAEVVAKARAVKRAGKSSKVMEFLSEANSKLANDANWSSLYPEILKALQ